MTSLSALLYRGQEFLECQIVPFVSGCDVYYSVTVDYSRSGSKRDFDFNMTTFSRTQLLFLEHVKHGRIRSHPES